MISHLFSTHCHITSFDFLLIQLWNFVFACFVKYRSVTYHTAISMLLLWQSLKHGALDCFRLLQLSWISTAKTKFLLQESITTEKHFSQFLMDLGFDTAGVSFKHPWNTSITLLEKSSASEWLLNKINLGLAVLVFVFTTKYLFKSF